MGRPITNEDMIRWYERISREQCRTAKDHYILSQEMKPIAEGWQG